MRRSRRVPATLLSLSAGLVGAGALFVSPASAQTVTPAVPTVTPPSITTIAGNGIAGYSGDGGVAVKAELKVPTGVAEDLTGSLYIADTANNRVRKVVTPLALNHDIITTIAGTGAYGFGGDNGPASAAKLASPSGLAVDSHGDVFIADTANNRVREVTPNGIITTYAGNGSCAFFGSIGNGAKATSASLCLPTGLALDHAGDLFISDLGHNVVREVLASTHTIVAFAGNGSYGSGGDGGKAVHASLFGPTGLAVDAVGDVYISDTGDNKVREVTTNGNIKTFAGTGGFGFGGDGGPATGARLATPTGIGVDPSGNVYISDTANNRIRKVNTAGIITTYAGTGVYGFSGDGGPATAAKLAIPTGAVVADGANVFFSDTGNSRVRGIFVGPPPVLPESPAIVLLPLSGVLLAGAGFVVLRRRKLHRLSVAL